MICRVCSIEKDDSRFEIIKHSGNRRKACRECIVAKKKARESSDPEKYSENRKYAVLKHKYGISREEYETRLSAQNGVCAICQQEETNGRWLSVDHCHNSMQVRGLLCHTCNTAIGMLKENVESLRRAINYLG